MWRRFAHTSRTVSRAASYATDVNAGATWSAVRPAHARSTTYAEALKRGRDLYRDACREIPWVMENYALSEVTSARKIRATLKEVMKANARTIEATHAPETRAAAMDNALMRAREELVALEAHHYQRHHLITQFVNPRCAEASGAGAARSAFVENFLSGGLTRLG